MVLAEPGAFSVSPAAPKHSPSPGPWGTVQSEGSAGEQLSPLQKPVMLLAKEVADASGRSGSRLEVSCSDKHCAWGQTCF